MSSCWRCGAPANPSDKFCGVCAASLAGQGAGQPQVPVGYPGQPQGSGQMPPMQQQPSGYAPYAPPPVQQAGYAPPVQQQPIGYAPTPVQQQPIGYAPTPVQHGAPVPGHAPFGAPVPGHAPLGAPVPGRAPSGVAIPGQGAPFGQGAVEAMAVMENSYASVSGPAGANASEGSRSAGVPDANVETALETGEMSPYPGQQGQQESGFAVAPPPAPLPGTGAELRGFLYSFHNVQAGEFWPLYQGVNVIGRLDAAEVERILINDPTISSQHATIVADQFGALTLHDTGSTNGTFVNDVHVGYEGTQVLNDGDRVRFGGYNAFIRIATR